MDIELLALLILSIVLIIIFVWWIWSLTSPPSTCGPRWNIQLIDSKNTNHNVWGALYMDPGNEILNYLIQIKGIRSNVRRVYFKLPNEHPSVINHPEGKTANHYIRNGYLVVAGIWTNKDCHLPLSEDITTLFFDQAVQLVVSTDSYPSGELISAFVLDQSTRCLTRKFPNGCLNISRR